MSCFYLVNFQDVIFFKTESIYISNLFHICQNFLFILRAF